MATCYVCHKEIANAFDMVGRTFVSRNDCRIFRRAFAHRECDVMVAQAEAKAMMNDPDFMGFDINGWPID